jgi:DNA-binding IclR family transcriptional regulator
VLALLGAFTPMRVTLSLTDLAKDAGLPVATTYRLAGELVTWGALERLPDGGYQIGMRLWRLGALAPGSRDLESVARRFMGDLHEATRENVVLAVPDGLRARCISAIIGRRSGTTAAGVGDLLPLRTTAVGKVILAFSAPALLAAVLENGPEATAVQRHLDEVRRNQVAYVLDEPASGASSVAAPIFGRDGSLAAAVALVVHSGTDVRPLAPAVRTAGLGVTRSLTAGA